MCKKLIFPILIVLVTTLSAFTIINSIDWKIADDYSIKFTSDDPSGIFKTMKGDIIFDENNLKASKFDVSVDVNSINTGNGMKNNDAKSANWFDAANYPEIKFVSTQIIKDEAGYKAKGNLSMRDVTKEITIPFTFTKTSAGALFVGSFDVNRKDYNIGLSNNHASDVLRIDISVPVIN